MRIARKHPSLGAPPGSSQFLHPPSVEGEVRNENREPLLSFPTSLSSFTCIVPILKDSLVLYTPYILTYIHRYHAITHRKIRQKKIPLHCITLHYSALPALHCIALHCTALHCIALYIHWITLLHTYERTCNHIRPLSPPPCYIQTFDKQNQADCMSRPPLRQIQVTSTRPSCNFTQEKVISKWLTSARVYSPNNGCVYTYLFWDMSLSQCLHIRKLTSTKLLGKCPAVHGIKSAGVCNLPSTALWIKEETPMPSRHLQPKSSRISISNNRRTEVRANEKSPRAPSKYQNLTMTPL